MHRHATWLIATATSLALLAGPAAVAAAPRIVVPHVQADRTGALSRQLAAALCGRFDCARRSAAYTASRPDFAKARRNGVSGIVFGAVGGSEANRHVWLALFTTSREPERTWTVPLRRSGLAPRRALEEIVREIERRLAPRSPEAARPAERAAPSPPVAVAPPAPATSRPPAPARVPSPPPPGRTEPSPATSPGPSATAAGPPIAPRPVVVDRAPPPRPRPAPPEPAAPAASSPARPRWASLELGAYVTSRSLDYAGASPAGTSPLQTMSADAIACPRAYLEVFPAAAAPPALAGLGLFADYRRSVGFDVRAGSDTHSAQLSRGSAGALWRLPPVTGWSVVLVPAVSYEWRDATVSGAIAGLPDVHLRGVRLGAGVELPFGARYALLLGGGWVRWTSAGDLARGGAFFPSGSASAVEAEAGLSIALFGRYSARLVGEYASTSYALDPDPTGTYRASAATDRYAGVRGSIRADF